jgi:hypothetical protein
MTPGWNHAETARYYERFCRRHPRYRVANAAPAAHAEIPRDARMPDLAPHLDLDFFHYSAETRATIAAYLKFKGEHNLRRMGLLTP